MIHIRKPLAPVRGNQWYRDKSVPDGATLCGAPCALYDVPYRDTQRKSFNIEDPFWATKGGFCPACMQQLQPGTGS